MSRGFYQDILAAGTITFDPAQAQVAAKLEMLAEALRKARQQPPKTHALAWLWRKSTATHPPPKGIYLYGGVGRGKSMLMDLFYSAVPIAEKKRVHFHAFMQEVHAALHRARAQNPHDALKPIAEALTRDLRLLCFDEMQINDITDAMLVGRLFEELMGAGVCLVITSNRPPKDLYKDGLNRALFLPFIEMLERRLDILALESAQDYRRHNTSSLASKYITPLGPEATMEIETIWHELSGGAPKTPYSLTHQGREISWPAFANGVALADFAHLCSKPLGAGDYLALCARARSVILCDVPQMSAARQNEAKRFVTLVDAIYEAQIELYVSAEAPPDQLYSEGKEAFEFERCASRLHEMQGAEWPPRGAS